jgi:hypothetical protein
MIIEPVKKFCSSFGTKIFIARLHYSNSILVKSEEHVSIITYSMEQSPSWEADKSSQLVKKIPRILWYPKVLYRTHKCPPPVLLALLRPAIPACDIFY